jgi:SET domain
MDTVATDKCGGDVWGDEEIMLGGISFNGISWTEEDDRESADAPGASRRHSAGRVDPSTIKGGRNRPLPSATTAGSSESRHQSDTRPYSLTEHDEEDDVLFENAYKCSGYGTPNYTVEKPPVRVVDFGDSNRGRGLVATRALARGEVIYTERAWVATQLLPAGNQEAVKACQTCFRSLESWTKLIPKKRNDDEGGGDYSSADLFPFPELWPVVPLEFEDFAVCDDSAMTYHNAAIRTDVHGRVQCTHCHAEFCSQACYSKKIDRYGTCCFETKVRTALPELMEEDYMEEGDHVIHAPVVLAISIFLQMIHGHRAHNASVGGHFMDRVCGTTDDLCRLMLGMRVSEGENAAIYTLQPVYDYLVELADVNEHEKQTFSLPLLHSFASKAARNGVGLTTESPFKPYFAGLLRKTNYGGLGSEAHNRHMEQLASALGTEKFHRGMDRDIEALVAPEVSAIFPLTTRCNHSCDPNAQIRSQEFADARIDVVATRPIGAGEEICISYIELGGVRRGRRSKFQRQKELLARYLFKCTCSLCANGDGLGDNIAGDDA